jgi:hypothetical protein
VVRRKPRVVNQCRANVFARPDEKIIEVFGPDGSGQNALISLRYVDGILIIEPYALADDVRVMAPTHADGRRSKLLRSGRTTPGVWEQTWEDGDGAPGWSLQRHDGGAENSAGELYAEVSGRGPYSWQIGESWEGGGVLRKGTETTLPLAQRMAELALSRAVRKASR